MPKRMIDRRAKAFAGLVILLALGACDRKQVAYTTPGWYLEKPHQLLTLGPQIFAGPMSYEQCEAERVKFPDDSARRLLCIMEKTKPGPLGPYDKIQAEKKA